MWGIGYSDRGAGVSRAFNNAFFRQKSSSRAELYRYAAYKSEDKANLDSRGLHNDDFSRRLDLS
jgi:hypothetical protein